MPTGYTSAIKDGITFETFALQCARAFGALVMMRDDRLDAPIPDEFKPSDYYSNRIHEIANEITKVHGMTEAEAEVASNAECEARCERARDHIAEATILQRKYEEMLQRVREWSPPTEEHTGLKDFMIQQILDSIKFDCSTDYFEDLRTAEPLPGIRWRKEKLATLHKEAGHMEEENRKEIARCKERTTWVKDLQASLKVQAPVGKKMS